MAKILAIIVTFNSAKWVDKCFGSIQRSSVPMDIFVADNASTDNCVELVRKKCPDAVIVENKDNLGFGAANNLGFKYALENGYDYVYLMNADAWIEDDTIAIMLGSDRHKDFGILSPLQLGFNGKLDRNFEKKCHKYINIMDRVCTVPFVMAAHWLVPVETLRKVGGFSPAFLHYGEDDNYIDRLHWFGLKVGVVPAAHAVHDRANRKETKARRMFMKWIAVKVRVSNPARNFFAMELRAPFELIGMSIKNFSFLPMKYIPRMFRKYEELGRYRNESRKEGAFLQ